MSSNIRIYKLFIFRLMSPSLIPRVSGLKCWFCEFYDIVIVSLISSSGILYLDSVQTLWAITEQC